MLSTDFYGEADRLRLLFKILSSLSLGEYPVNWIGGFIGGGGVSRTLGVILLLLDRLSEEGKLFYSSFMLRSIYLPIF